VDLTEMVGMIAAVLFLMTVIHISIDMQLNAIDNAAEFSERAIGPTLKSEAAALHLLNHEDSEDFGVFQRDDFERLAEECGDGKIKGIDRDDPVDIEIATSENSCDQEASIKQQVILGLKIEDEGGEARDEKLQIY
jgi:hypothetical protein